MSEQKRPLVLGIGEILWDLLPEGKHVGGAPANFAFHVAQLGADGRVVSCVGGDPLGDELLEVLRTRGLSTDGVAVLPDRPTGTVTVEVDAHGKPTFTIHQGVAWDHMPTTDTMLDWARQAAAVCYGTLFARSETSRATLLRLLDATPPDCLRVFDVNLRQHYYDAKTLTIGLEAANVLKLNDEELPIIARLLRIGSEFDDAMAEGDIIPEHETPESVFDEETTTPPGRGSAEDTVISRRSDCHPCGDCGDVDATVIAVIQALLSRFSLKLVALTRGARGSMLVSPTECRSHPGVSTDVADTIGAGDAFTAAMTVGLLGGTPLETIAARANQLAAYVSSQKGATPTLPEGLF